MQVLKAGEEKTELQRLFFTLHSEFVHMQYERYEGLCTFI